MLSDKSIQEVTDIALKERGSNRYNRFRFVYGCDVNRADAHGCSFCLLIKFSDIQAAESRTSVGVRVREGVYVITAVRPGPCD